MLDLELVHNLTYYGSVRAIDHFGHISEVAISDGIEVDTFNPTVGIPHEGSLDDLDYQGPSDTLAIYWEGQDPASRELSYYEYAVGSTPGGTDKHPWSDNGMETSVNILDFELEHESTYYASVRAYDMAGNVSNIVSGDGLTMDSPVSFIIPTIITSNSSRMFESLIKIPSYWVKSFKEISSKIRFKSACFGETTDIESSTCGFDNISAIR